MIDTLRSILAIALAVSVPPAVCLWFAIHPFARFWRRLGASATYGILALPFAGCIYGLYRIRGLLLGPDLGLHLPAVAGGVFLLAVSAGISRLRRKHLTFRILAGVPELSRAAGESRLLSEGIYARIRHPRYVEFTMGLLGWILIAGYAHLYILWLGTVAAIYLVVLIEERELRQRFGKAYEDYARRVPRFLPRRRGATPGPPTPQP